MLSKDILIYYTKERDVRKCIMERDMDAEKSSSMVQTQETTLLHFTAK